MPYDARGLTPLLAAGPFSMWHYRTADGMTAVTAPGYFVTAADRLLVGHVMVVQAADALSLLPLREGAAVGSGQVLDAIASPVQFEREVLLRFGASGAVTVTVSGAAGAAPRALGVDAVSGLSTASRTFTVRATAQGPVRELRCTLLNASGTVIAGPVAATVVAGRAQAELTVPPDGDGYRVRVVDADDAQLGVTSQPFSVTQAPTVPVGSSASALLTEAGGTLRMENGDRLVS